MFSSWLTFSIVLAALALLVTFLLGCQSWEHRRFARKRLRACLQGANRRSEGIAAKRVDVRACPRIALFAPCKGIDVGLQENLRPLFLQDHGNYELVFIVESNRDPACPIIHDLMAEFPHVDSRLVVAGMAADVGQKVHNLRVATRRLDAEVEILAFIDSDARPSPSWLRSLVKRLDCPEVGITTGYRWFMPERPTLANLLLHSINATAASMYSPRGVNLVWGGSWAMRRDRFDQLELRDVWDGMLTDDLVATNLVQGKKLRVEFEPACMIASPIDLSLGEMFNFLRRQYMIGRHYLPGLWAITLLATTIMTVGFWAALATSVVAFGFGVNWAWMPATACTAIYLWGMFRATIRRDLVKLYFPARRQALARAIQFDLFATPLAMAVNWAAILSTVGARHIRWRGITYRLLRGGMTRIVSRQQKGGILGVYWPEDTPAMGGQDNQPTHGLPPAGRLASQKSAENQQGAGATSRAA